VSPCPILLADNLNNLAVAVVEEINIKTRLIFAIKINLLINLKKIFFKLKSLISF